MKILVIGGTGLIGSKLVATLTDHGHEAVPASPRLGVNTITGAGLADAMDGTSVVVDVSNSPNFEYATALEFFRTSTRNVLAAEAAASVGHHVALSVVGTATLAESGDPNTTTAGYFRAKLAQEELIRASSIPFSIVHATQFFEFLKGIADGATDGNTVRLAPVLIQPMAAEDVATEVTKVAVGAPLNAIVEVGGPEQFRLNEIVGRYLAARDDRRSVIADPNARYYGAKLEERTLVPESNATIGETKFEDWLSRQLVSA